MPDLARTVARLGYPRVGLLRALLLEVGGRAADTDKAAMEAERVVGALMTYLDEQMTPGRLRRIAPLLASQAFYGPIFLHLLTVPG
jgi:hypothetical protein